MKKMLLILVGFVMAAVDAGIGFDTFVDDGEGNITFDVRVETDADIAGFEIDLISNGMMELNGSSAASGGLAGDNGFMMSTNATKVIGFSLTGSVVPAGSEGVLFSVSATYDPNNNGQQAVITALEEGSGGSRLLFAGSGGTSLDCTFWDRNWIIGTGADDLGVDGIVNKFELNDNYPNPFNPSTSISFSLANYGEVSLIIFDALGREVDELVSGIYTPGSYNVMWNGTDSNGNEMSSGMYFYRLNAGEFTQTKKMLFMK